MNRHANDLINRVRGLVRSGSGDRQARRLVADLGGQLVYIGPSPAEIAQMRVPAGEDRADVVSAWAASGALTWGEAERLVALDESTGWGQKQ